MTQKEALIVSAYTGIMIVKDFNLLHKFIEETMGGSVYTHEMGDKEMMEELKDRLRPLLLEIVENIQLN